MTRTVLWVVPVSALGGVARHVLDVADVGLPGWRLVVLCPEGPLAEQLRARNAAVLTGPFGPDAGAPASIRFLRSQLRRLRPAVIHSHLAFADVVTALASWGLPTRVVTTEHGIADDDTVYHGSVWKAKAKAWMHRLRLRRADAVIAVSAATADVMRRKWRPRQEIVVIPNGVDPEEVAGRIGSRVPAEDGTGPRVLSLSRLSPEKRIDVLLEAFALIRAERPGATLTVAGEGPEKESLEALARRLGLEPGASFPGFLDSGTAMAHADLMVQLSTWENCSYTLLDAAVAGIPVVASDVGGNREILPPEALVQGWNARRIADAVLRAAGKSVGPSEPIRRAEMAARVVREYEARP